MADYSQQWKQLLLETQKTTDAVAAECGFGFADLVRQEYQKFSQSKTPRDEYELELRDQEQMNLSAKIASVAGADKAAKAHRLVAPAILTATRAFCVHVSLRDNVVQEGIQLSTEINTLCAK